MNNAKLQLEVGSPTSIKCGHIEWFALDTKLVGKLKALLEENEKLNNILNEIKTMCKEHYYARNTTDIDSIGLSNDLSVMIYMKIKELIGD